MAQKVFNIIIKLLKEGGADKETVSGLIDIKNALVTGAAIAGTFAVAYKTVDKVLDETVGKFATYAAGVDVFHSALTTTTEEASRLIQVADDFGISAEEMQKSMFRAVKEGMEPTIEGLAGMADEYNALATPQEKADFLVKNFGKSSQELTRLLGEGGQAIRDRAAAVSEGLVMDEAAIQKARDYAFAQDELNDSIDGYKIAMGERFIPAITAGIVSMTDAATANQLYTRAMELGIDVGRNMGTGMVAVNGVLVDQTELLRLVKIAEEEAADAAYYLAGGDDEAARSLAKMATGLKDAGDAAGMTDEEFNTLYRTIGTLQKITDDYNTTQGELVTKQGEIITAIDLAISQGYSPAGTKIQGLKTDLENVNTELENNAKAFEDNSKRAIFAMIASAAAADSWQAGEFDALMGVAEAWGIYSPEVVTQAKNIQDALDDVDSSNLGDIQGYAEWMIAHPNISQSFDIWVTTHENIEYTYTGAGCFIAGTLVTLASGDLKPIEEIRVGEWVLSWNIKTDEQIKAEVCKVFHHAADIMSGFILVNNTLGITPEHSIFVNGHWAKAGRLHLGDSLMDMNGQTIIIKKLEWIENRQPVYNLHTRHKTHNYFAGGVLVHNTQAKMKMAADYGRLSNTGRLTDYGRNMRSGGKPLQLPSGFELINGEIRSGGKPIQTGIPISELITNLIGGGNGRPIDVSISQQNIQDLASAIGFEIEALRGAEVRTPPLAGDYGHIGEIRSGGKPIQIPAGPERYTRAQNGGDFWVQKPTFFLAGEAGPERATFTPQGSAPANAPEMGRLMSAVASQTVQLRSLQSALEDMPGLFAAEIQKRM